MSKNNQFGQELRRLRRSHADNLSLADVADAIGCSITYMSAIERGDRNPPSNDKIAKILKYLGQEDHLENMISLAVRARKSVEIPIDGTSPEWTEVFIGLARRSENGLRDDDPLLAKLTELLNDEDE